MRQGIKLAKMEKTRGTVPRKTWDHVREAAHPSSTALPRARLSLMATLENKGSWEGPADPQQEASGVRNSRQGQSLSQHPGTKTTIWFAKDTQASTQPTHGGRGTDVPNKGNSVTKSRRAALPEPILTQHHRLRGGVTRLSASVCGPTSVRAESGSSGASSASLSCPTPKGGLHLCTRSSSCGSCLFSKPHSLDLPVLPSNLTSRNFLNYFITARLVTE